MLCVCVLNETVHAWLNPDLCTHSLFCCDIATFFFSAWFCRFFFFFSFLFFSLCCPKRVWEMTWLDLTWLDLIWLDSTWLDLIWLVWLDSTRLDSTWLDLTWLDLTWLVWFDSTWLDLTWLDLTRLATPDSRLSTRLVWLWSLCLTCNATGWSSDLLLSPLPSAELSGPCSVQGQRRAVPQM